MLKRCHGAIKCCKSLARFGSAGLKVTRCSSRRDGRGSIVRGDWAIEHGSRRKATTQTRDKSSLPKTQRFMRYSGCSSTFMYCSISPAATDTARLLGPSAKLNRRVACPRARCFGFSAPSGICLPSFQRLGTGPLVRARLPMTCLPSRAGYELVHHVPRKG